MDFVNELEKELLIAANTAIRRGRFQKLPREINKMIKETETANADKFSKFKKLMRILQSFPLLEAELDTYEEAPGKTKSLNTNHPSIIISESFSA